MTLKQRFKNYQSSYKVSLASKQLVIIYVLIIAMFVFASIWLAINYFGRDYPGILYVAPISLLYMSPLILLLNLGSLYYLKSVPFLSFFTWSYTTFFLIAIAAGLIATGIQFTPFPYIDRHLIQWDIFFHFNTVALITFTHNHPFLHEIFSFTYDMVIIQLILICVVLPLFKNQERSMVVYFIALCFSYIIGTTIYYFFPSIAPTHFFHVPYFSASEHNVFIKYYDIHHYLPIKRGGGGIISFPSFHVIWAVLFIYAYRNVKWLFYIFLIINSVAILATLFLGWHYLVDVIAGAILAVFSIIVAEHWFKKFSSERLVS